MGLPFRWGPLPPRPPAPEREPRLWCSPGQDPRPHSAAAGQPRASPRRGRLAVSPGGAAPDPAAPCVAPRATGAPAPHSPGGVQLKRSVSSKLLEYNEKKKNLNQGKWGDRIWEDEETGGGDGWAGARSTRCSRACRSHPPPPRRPLRHRRPPAPSPRWAPRGTRRRSRCRSRWNFPGGA